MDYTLFVSLVGFAFIAAITPGPNNLLLMSSGALFGLRKTVPHLIGIQLGFATLATASVFGLGTLVDRWPWLITVVRLLGASWLVWLSIRFFRAAVQNQSTEARMEKAPISRPFRFVEAILFQWVNPKGIITAVSSAGAYIAIAETPLQRAAILAVVFMITGTFACTTWTIAGDSLNRYMSSGQSATWMNAGMGVLIVATAALILLG
ncbi:MAG: LysE family translocator [Gammaproteobacteria bacterium]|nr:LysE family translocator [Gammaproteobacteria bacterium]